MMSGKSNMIGKDDRELYVLVFHARRMWKKNWLDWFRFLQRNYAEIYAHVYGEDEKEAREVAEYDIRRKGFEITKYITINKFRELNYPPGILQELEKSLKYRTRYTFYGLSKSEFEVLEGKAKTGSASVTSRYADYAGVLIDLGKVPRELRDILPYAKMWAICDDVERKEYKRQIATKDVNEFYRAVASKIEIIEAYCDRHRDEAPVPDEVVLFDLMLEAFTEITPGIGYINETVRSINGSGRKGICLGA